MSEGSQVSEVTLCVEILKWHPLTHWVTKVRYRAARAAKNVLKKYNQVSDFILLDLLKAIYEIIGMTPNIQASPTNIMKIEI